MLFFHLWHLPILLSKFVTDSTTKKETAAPYSVTVPETYPSETFPSETYPSETIPTITSTEEILGKRKYSKTCISRPPLGPVKCGVYLQGGLYFQVHFIDSGNSLFWKKRSHVSGCLYIQWLHNTGFTVQKKNFNKIAVARVTIRETAAPPNFICLCVCLITRCALFTT